MFNELYINVRNRFGDSATSDTMSEWIMANTRLRRRPFSFEGYEFQRAIVDDLHTDMSVIKPSQVGLTEVQLRKFFGLLARRTGLNGIFSLPTEPMRNRVYSTRIRPLVEQDEIFNPVGEKPVRNRELVQIRDSFGHILGCGEGDATSTPADFAFHDELDLSPMDNIALYQSRLQNSDMRVTQKFSTPTYAGYGIDKAYQMTDMREYVVKCAACNHYQIPLFTPRFVHVDNFPYEVADFKDLTAEQILRLDLESSHLRCERCSRPLDMTDPSLREWVAKHPSRDTFRGYWVRPFSTSRLTPRYVFTQLAKYQQDGFLRGFYNTVIGEPFADKNAQIQEADIAACMTREDRSPSPGTPVYMGVDVGFVCHITLSYDDPTGRPIYFHFETVNDRMLLERINDLRSSYRIVQGAIDRFPFEPVADAIRLATNDLVMPVQYRGHAPLTPVRDELGDVTHYSSYNTYTMDRLHVLITNHALTIAGYGNQKEVIITHLTDNIRDDTPGSGGAVWRKNPGNDHYFHAMVFGQLARRIHEHNDLHVPKPKALTSGVAVAPLTTPNLGIGLQSGAGARKVSKWQN